MGKRKIAILDNSIDVTGALNSILGFAEYARNDFSFLFILPVKSKASERLRDLGFEVIEIPFIEISRSGKSLFMYFPQLLVNGYELSKIIEKENVEIVHVNDFYNMVGIMAKALGGRFKLITHVRFMPNRFPSILVNSWMKFNLKFSEKIICVSNAVKNFLQDHSKMTVIYDGLPNFMPRQTKQIEEKACLNLLYLGHYIRGKGQDLALEAFYQAFQKNSLLRLRFVGGDLGLQKNKAFKSQLVERVRELALDEYVEIADFSANIKEEMASADIVLNFSESESFSMTCLEALVSGVPLIASDCGGPAELFENGISGILVQNKNIEAMSNAILHLAGDQKKRQKFSRNSIIYVEEKFSSGATYHQLRQTYLNALTD